MLIELDNYDWEEVFSYAQCPDAANPIDDVDVSPVNREDVVEIIAMDDGENDGEEWIGVFKLKDGRYAVVIAGCDYTGWECRASGHAVVAKCMADILVFGLSESEQKRLGL